MVKNPNGYLVRVARISDCDRIDEITYKGFLKSNDTEVSPLHRANSGYVCTLKGSALMRSHEATTLVAVQTKTTYLATFSPASKSGKPVVGKSFFGWANKSVIETEVEETPPELVSNLGKGGSKLALWDLKSERSRGAGRTGVSSSTRSPAAAAAARLSTSSSSTRASTSSSTRESISPSMNCSRKGGADLDSCFASGRPKPPPNASVDCFLLQREISDSPPPAAARGNLRSRLMQSHLVGRMTSPKKTALERMGSPKKTHPKASGLKPEELSAISHKRGSVASVAYLPNVIKIMPIRNRRSSAMDIARVERRKAARRNGDTARLARARSSISSGDGARALAPALPRSDYDEDFLDVMTPERERLFADELDQEQLEREISGRPKKAKKVVRVMSVRKESPPRCSEFFEDVELPQADPVSDVELSQTDPMSPAFAPIEEEEVDETEVAIVGCVTYATAESPWALISDPDEAEIRMLAVVARAGVARTLVGEILRLAQREQRKAVNVLVPQGSKAATFYRKQGFIRVPHKDRRDDRTGDALKAYMYPIVENTTNAPRRASDLSTVDSVGGSGSLRLSAGLRGPSGSSTKSGTSVNTVPTKATGGQYLLNRS